MWKCSTKQQRQQNKRINDRKRYKKTPTRTDKLKKPYNSTLVADKTRKVKTGKQGNRNGYRSVKRPAISHSLEILISS